MADTIKAFFDEWERVWDSIPGYVKVFIYSTISSVIGLYASGVPVEVKSVVLIVLTNMGLYSGVRTGAGQIRKML